MAEKRSSKSSIVDLKNLARGNESYRRNRHGLFRIILEARVDLVSDLNPFLKKKLLKLSPGNWYALAFDADDWKALRRIRKENSVSVSENLLSLVRGYISENSEQISQMIKASGEFSNALLADDVDRMNSAVNSLSPECTQSLFYFRLLCAQKARVSEELVTSLKGMLKTDWLEKRFLYPLVYYSVNSPTDTGLDSFLSYVLSGNEDTEERATIRLLLSDQAGLEESISFKCYIALLTHPYDAVEILLSHIEQQIAVEDSIDQTMISLLNFINIMVPSPRSRGLQKICNREVFLYSDSTDHAIVRDSSGFDDNYSDLIARFVSLDEKIDEKDTDGSQLSRLISLRSQRYPNPANFEKTQVIAQKWRFLDAGRIIYSLMSSLYMFPRTTQYLETRDFNRLLMYCDRLTPFIALSPRGRSIIRRYSNFSESVANIIGDVDTVIRSKHDTTSRLWIKYFQWEVQEYEDEVKIRDWLKCVRQQAEIKRLYLSGVDWNWFSMTLKKTRLVSLIGNPDAAFALLLMQVEEPSTDPNLARIALEPIIEGKSLSDFVSWILDEFGEVSPAFIYHFLTTSNILLSGLASNETAALAGRVQSLETCVRSIGFDEMLTEEIYVNEIRSLNSALILRSVDKSQFEVPWALFKKEVIENQSDLFDVRLALTAEAEQLPILGEAMVSSPFPFPNGQISDYSFKNSEWPVASLILQIISDFIQHPSFGLEAILSIRIRHDSLMKEFVRTLADLKEQGMPGVVKYEQIQLCNAFAKPITLVLSDWIDQKIHSERKQRPDGLFNLTPSQADMRKLIAEASALSEKDIFAQCVINWLISRLEDNLVGCRESFEGTLLKQLIHSIDLTAESKELCDTHRSADIERVAEATRAAMTRLLSELVEWFAPQITGEPVELTVSQIKLATDGVFEREIVSGTLNVSLDSEELSRKRVLPEHGRLFLNIFEEVYRNALKYADTSDKPLIISGFREGGHLKGIAFHSSGGDQPTKSYSVRGHPYESVSDAISSEGNTGLVKIASLSATILGAKVDIQVAREGNYFDLLVPLFEDVK